MAKKKTKKKGWGFSSSSQSLNECLKQFDKYIVNQQWLKAKQKLEELEQRFPPNKEIFKCWLTLADEQGDQKTYQQKAEEFTLKCPDEADAYLAFIGACIENTYPLLALQTLETFCAKFPHDPNISEANKTRTEIKTFIPELLKDFDLPEERALELGTLNEKGRFLVEMGQSNQARQLFEDLLQLAPNLSPALNNLSLILCSQGELREAIALAMKKKTPEVAHSWLGIWKQIGDEDDSNLDYWCNRLEGKSSWFFK